MAGIDVVIPAGGQIDESFARVVGTTSKALIVLEEKTVLRRTIEALRASGRVGRIVVVGSDVVLKHEDSQLADAALPETGTGPSNIAAGVAHLSTLNFPPDQVMIVTADLPYLTPECINKFLDLCVQETDFNVPLISKADYIEAYPGAEAMFVKLLDGEWTTGCIYVTTVRGLKVAMPHIEDVFKRRKSKLGIARLLGMKFVWDYFNKKLTVNDIEAKVVELLRCRGKAIPGSPPELAHDIDYIEDYQYVLTSLQSRRAEKAV